MFVFVWYALLYVLSNFAIILTRKRQLAFLLLSFGCLVTVNVPWLSSRCHALVYSVLLWYFLIKLTNLRNS